MSTYPAMSTRSTLAFLATILLAAAAGAQMPRRTGAPTARDVPIPGRSHAAFIIAQDGKAAAEIVIPEDAIPSTRAAAKLLKDYFGVMSGGSFYITQGLKDAGKRPRILVGFPEDEVSRSEEYMILARGTNELVVTGQGTRGTLYGASALLEYLGCGFWTRGNETVPEKKTLSIPAGMKRRSAPVFEYRQPLGNPTYSREWRSKVAINGDMWMLWAESTPEMGGAFHMSMGQWAYGIPRKELKDKHPQWMAWHRDSKSRTDAALCLSNTELLEQVVANIKADHARHPENIYYNLSFGDTDVICQCDDCSKLVRQEGNASGLVIYAANYVARKIAAECPDARVMVLGFWITATPPRSMRLEPNVHITCAKLRDFNKPPSGDAGYTASIREWSKRADGNVFIWDYSCNFRNYISPTPYIDMMGPTFREYAQWGVRGVMSQMSMNPLTDFIDLRCWIFAKLMWNPFQDEWKLIDQWCDGACGAGAPYMKEWLRYQKRRIRGKYFGPYMPDTCTSFDAADILKGYELFQQALEATRDDARTHRQIRKQYTTIVVPMLQRYNLDIAKKARLSRKTIPPRAELFKIFESNIAEFEVREWQGFAEGRGYNKFIEDLRNDTWYRQ